MNNYAIEMILYSMSLGNFKLIRYAINLRNFHKQFNSRFTINHLESQIEPYKYLVDLCIDSLFKASEDTSFRKWMRNLGFGALFHIALPCTFAQYKSLYDRVCFHRLTKIIRFKSNVLEYVENNRVELENKMGQISTLFYL